MARPQGRENASTNKRASEIDAAEYVAWLESQPLAVRTREAYAAVIVAFAGWLDGHDGGLDGPRARDLAARDYKRFLKVERGLGPASVNQGLAALDHFFRFLGLGAAIVQREELPRAAPRALSVEEQRLLLRAAEESSPRDRAIVALLPFTGVRLSESARGEQRNEKCR